ncbi:MAG: PGF-CTERM sorting domain-containing protein, partial [Candidatus Syntropharchaeia archaeon]
KMEAFYDNASHVGYGEWFSHTVTDTAKDCAFCHESKEVLCEGCEGDILGKGGSFIPQETIDRIYVITAPTLPPPPTPAPTPTPTPTPGFGAMVAAIGILAATYIIKRR